MIEKYLVDYSGNTIGIKYDPNKTPAENDRKFYNLIIGGRQRVRPQILFFVTNILGFSSDDIVEVVYRQGNKIRYHLNSEPVDFHLKLDKIAKSPLDVHIKTVEKIRSLVM